MEAYRLSLFIFSFRNNSAKLVTLIITGLVFYSWVLQTIKPVVTTFQSQAIRNYSIAERYIYTKANHRAVIVGSSMSNRLLKEQFDEDVYNLSFGGGSVLTGLALIKESHRIPDSIFIESNIAYKEIDDAMIENLFVPILWKIRSNILSLQYTYQPINIILSKIKSRYEKKGFTGSDSIPNDKILKSNLKIHLRDNSHANKLAGNKELVYLKELVTYFKKMGTKVVFFEMPVHPELLSSRKYVELRSILQTSFPDSKFYWAENAVAGNYLTSDGVHLLHKSACEYSQLLSGLIQRELQRPPLHSAVKGGSCR
jgi:hypothetical protein